MTTTCLSAYSNVCQSRAKKDMRYESERGAWSYESESTRLDSKWWQMLLLSTRGYTTVSSISCRHDKGSAKFAREQRKDKQQAPVIPQSTAHGLNMISCCNLSEKKKMKLRIYTLSILFFPFFFLFLQFPSCSLLPLARFLLSYVNKHKQRCFMLG